MLMWGMLVVGVISISLWLVGSGRIGRWMSAAGLPPIEPQLARVWIAWIAAGTVLFAIAHMVAFQLHSPNRFSRYTIGLTFGMITALATAILFLGFMLALASLKKRGRVLSFGLLAMSACGLLWISIRFQESNIALIWTAAPNIESYLRTTPKDTLVAGVVKEIDSVPAFGARRVLGSLKLLSPYKKTYYREMATRMTALAIALYAPDRSAFTELVARYDIDYVLVERSPIEELANLFDWAANFPAILDTARAVENGRPPFFRARLDQCVRAEDGNLVLADALCLAASPRSGKADDR